MASAACATLLPSKVENLAHFGAVGLGMLAFAAFVTNLPFTGSCADDFPSGGELIINGANGSQVRVEVLDAVNLRLYIDAGDGSAITIVDTTWAAVLGI